MIRGVGGEGWVAIGNGINSVRGEGKREMGWWVE